MAQKSDDRADHTLIIQSGDVSGVLLAGGRSTRMGRDKSRLMVLGCPLWRRQLDVLRDAGASNLLLSGSPGGPWVDAEGEWTLLTDDWPESGPLAGLAAAFEAMRGQWLVVLAVDMPRMEAAYLRALLDYSRSAACGMVPFRDDLAEPLAAVYPREMGRLAVDFLQARELSLQAWVREGIRQGMVQSRCVPTAERKFFLNINTPSDYAELQPEGGE